MNKNLEDNYYQISQTEHEGWQLSQLQYYVQTMLDLSEADKKDLESKVEQYHSNVTGFKDKIKTRIYLSSLSTSCFSLAISFTLSI